MKRRLFLCLPFVVGGAYGYWVSTPRLDNPDYIELLERQANERLERCLEMGASPETNGALSPIFDGFWDRKASSELAAIVSVLKARSIYREEDDYLDQISVPEDRADPRGRLQKVLPVLHNALTKPVFFSGKVGFDSADITLDFLDCQNLGMALSAEAASLALKGDSDGFLRCIRSILGLSRGYRAFPILIRLLISQSIADIALQTALHAYSPDSKGAPWSAMSQHFYEAVPSHGELVLCMKCEFAFGDAAYQGVLDGNRPMEDISETDERISLWRRLPGQVTRERRAYRRDFAEFIAALENGEDAAVLTTDLAKKFNAYFRNSLVRSDFHRTSAQVFEKLGAREPQNTNSVVFDVEDRDANIEIVSSKWVESKGRKIIFHLAF